MNNTNQSKLNQENRFQKPKNHKRKSKNKTFVFEIEINANEWEYKEGQKLMVPVTSISEHHAYMKLLNRTDGSECPNFEIKEIHKCDNFLFNPLRFN